MSFVVIGERNVRDVSGHLHLQSFREHQWKLGRKVLFVLEVAGCLLLLFFSWNHVSVYCRAHLYLFQMGVYFCNSNNNPGITLKKTFCFFNVWIWGSEISCAQTARTSRRGDITGTLLANQRWNLGKTWDHIIVASQKETWNL